MSKSGNYNLGEIEKRDEIIQDLVTALKFCATLMHADTSAKGKADYSVVRAALDKVEAA